MFEEMILLYLDIFNGGKVLKCERIGNNVEVIIENALDYTYYQIKPQGASRSAAYKWDFNWRSKK